MSNKNLPATKFESHSEFVIVEILLNGIYRPHTERILVASDGYSMTYIANARRSVDGRASDRDTDRNIRANDSVSFCSVAQEDCTEFVA